MMGFGEQAGVIPRFCQELFSRLASMENEEVKCHKDTFILALDFVFCSHFPSGSIFA